MAFELVVAAAGVLAWTVDAGGHLKFGLAATL
jgi:hypothetical protein